MAMSLVDIAILRLNTRTTFRFSARMTPIRANIVGPRRDRDQVRAAQAEVEWWIFAHPKSVFRHIVTGGRCCSKKPLKYTFAHSAPERMPDFCMEYAALGYHGERQ
jgi:hypothetical protein